LKRSRSLNQYPDDIDKRMENFEQGCRLFSHLNLTGFRFRFSRKNLSTEKHMVARSDVKFQAQNLTPDDCDFIEIIIAISKC